MVCLRKLRKGSEVWSLESSKTDEQVELEIIQQFPKKSKCKIPKIPQNSNFTVKLDDALEAYCKKGEIVWFNMDGSNWPCLVLNSFSDDVSKPVPASNAFPVPSRKETVSNGTLKTRVSDGSVVNPNGITNGKPVVKQAKKLDDLKFWKIWPGASVLKRNIFGRKLLSYSKSLDEKDVVLDSEEEKETDVKTRNIFSDGLESIEDESTSSDDYSISDFEQESIVENPQKKRKYASSSNSSDDSDSDLPVLKKHSINLKYDLLPLPLSKSLLNEIWTQIPNSSFSETVNSTKLENVSKNNVKPWLHKDILPVPTDDETRNLSLLQAIHTSCSWSIPESILSTLKNLEKDYDEINSNSTFLSIPIQFYRHGTEIIHVGDLTRLVTNLRQTRNVISNQTTQILYIVSLNVISQLSFYQDSTDCYWNHDVILYGLVYEPRGTNCVPTGEYMTVSTNGICGRWYSSLSNINRKMPAIEESDWVL